MTSGCGSGDRLFLAQLSESSAATGIDGDHTDKAVAHSGAVDVYR
ncbi:MAG: hypothetical protein ABI867_38925 [Kofleriaceae bacterium]